MLEARLLVKLVEAKTLWDTPPHYMNDAQDVIKEAVAMAVDTEWENRLENILNHEHHSTFEQLLETFLANHPGTTKDNLYDADHKEIHRELERKLDKNTKQCNDHVTDWLGGLINQLCTSIGDKVHRRNLQIADLKRQLREESNYAQKLVTDQENRG